MKKSAFTMLELVFVIVVIGILAAVFIPRFERDNAGEAAYQIARHIRLAQHHALVEDKFSTTDSDWWKGMWAITFRTTKNCYAVYNNQDYATGGTQADQNESAVDPLTRKRLYSDINCNENTATTDDVLLWKKFGVDSLTLTNCGTNNQILFDHLGRPYGSAGNLLVNNNCVITLGTKDGHSAEITVYKETGFVKVTKIDATGL
ncbi:type II secretion system protein [Sulfurimonas diazotrophicus]|uniref:Type II secretion system protein n=1 Tax=Sulfurimonas diazotrophicus TaxID=3131939 RepID=A0ABZ3H873_9BACT